MELLKDTSEFDAMQVMTKVTPELSFGHGQITTELIQDDEASERATTLKNYIEDADPSAGCGCIDGRCVMHTLAGNEAKLGPKLAGGNTITSFFSMELNNYFEDDGSAFVHFARAVWLLEHAGKPVRFHTDNRTKQNIIQALDTFKEDINSLSLDEFTEKLDAADLPEATACGMNDGLAGAFYNMSRLPKQFKQEDGTRREESEEEITNRIGFVRTVTDALDPENFNADLFEQQVDRATKLHKSGFLDGWQSIKAALVAEKVLRDLNSTDSILDRIDVLEASDEGLYGHTEWAVAAHKIHGKVLNTSRYYKETGREVFGIELWAAEDNATALATSTDSENQKQTLYQGQLAAQASGYVNLGDGSQRFIYLAA